MIFKSSQTLRVRSYRRCQAKVSLQFRCPRPLIWAKPGDARLAGEFIHFFASVIFQYLGRFGARADQPHIPGHHAPQVWQLVDGELAQDPSNPSEPRIVLTVKFAPKLIYPGTGPRQMSLREVVFSGKAKNDRSVRVKTTIAKMIESVMLEVLRGVLVQSDHTLLGCLLYQRGDEGHVGARSCRVRPDPGE
jgi:hypothetical protein